VHNCKVGAEWVEGGPKFLVKRRCEGIRVLCHIIHARAESADVVANREEQPFECSADVVNLRVRLSKLFHYFVKVTKISILVVVVGTVGWASDAGGTSTITLL
jgi:hypothetical protein